MGGQAISLGGARGGSWYSFLFVVPPFWIVFFRFFPRKKNKKTGYHEPPGHPLDWLLAPIKGSGRTVWSFDYAALVGFWEFGSQLGSRQRSRLWTLRASGINKLRRLGRSTKSLWVSNRALFIVFCLFCVLFVFLIFFVCFFGGVVFVGLFFLLVVNICWFPIKWSILRHNHI